MNAAGVAIREGGAGDAAGGFMLLQAAFSPIGVIDPPLGALREGVESLAAKIAGGETLLVAEIGAEPVGCLFCRPRSPALYVGRLGVRPDAQGRGVAKALLAAAERVARENGLSRLQLNAREAIPQNVALFARLGFVVVGDGRHDGYDVVTYRVMERPVER